MAAGHSFATFQMKLYRQKLAGVRSGPGSRLVGNNQTNNVQIMTFHFSNLKQDAKVSEVTV